MNQQEKEVFDNIRSKFTRIMTSKELSVEDQTVLLNGITVLIGFFTVTYDSEIEAAIKQMMDFAESRNLSMLSQYMGFEYAVQKHLTKRQQVLAPPTNRRK